MSLLQIAVSYAIPGAAALLLLAAAFHDVALRTIPNAVCTSLMLVGAILRLQDGWLIQSLMLSGGVFMITTLIWQRGWMGGGDVKLLTATTLVVFPQHVVDFVLLTVLCGGVLGLFYLAFSRIVRVAPPG